MTELLRTDGKEIGWTGMSEIRRKRKKYWVYPHSDRIVKLFPSEPPQKGDTILVNDVRCRVVKSIVKWNGPRWTFYKAKVKEL